MNILKFKGLSSVFGIAILLTIVILMLMSMIATVDAAVSTVKVIEDNGKIGVQKSSVAEPQGEIEKKFKKVKTYTLTFNANGGKVGTKSKKLATKKTYGTLPKPTRSGYTFEGWFTAKKGGKKVSKTTKMPAKNVVVYAQWKKQRTLNADEKKLVGSYTYGSSSGGFWTRYSSTHNTVTDKWIEGWIYEEGYNFNADGTYEYFQIAGGSAFKGGGSYITGIGTWSVLNGKLHEKNQICNTTYNDGTRIRNEKYKDIVTPFIFDTKNGKQGIKMGGFFYEKDRQIGS